MLKKVFTPELSLIENEDVRALVVAVLNNLDIDAVGAGFIVAQGAYTKGHHPECTHVEGGVLIHVKRVVHMAEDKARALALTPREKDRVIAASILHDIYKGNRKTFQHHAFLGAEYICRVAASMPDRKLTWFEVTQITNCVAFHMGPWTHESIRKGMEKYTLPELATYLADYVAAQPDIALPVDSFDPAPFIAEWRAQRSAA